MPQTHRDKNENGFEWLVAVAVVTLSPPLDLVDGVARGQGGGLCAGPPVPLVGHPPAEVEGGLHGRQEGLVRERGRVGEGGGGGLGGRCHVQDGQ